MKLVIFYLTDSARHYTFNNFINLLNESNLKHLWEIIILSNHNDIDFYREILNKTDLNHKEFIPIHTNDISNYLIKVNFAINYAKDNNIPYMMKCDNDIYLRGRTLDFMIENLELLNNNINLTIGPELSSGIPCVEYFSEDFLEEGERNSLHNLFLQTEFTDIWGARYTHHNKFTRGASKWDGREFLNDVKQNPHHYKGIHPVRVNIDAQQYLNTCIINNKHKFYEDRQLSVIEDNISPYLCNSIFCIRTDIYEKIVGDRSLYVDDFEEVPLNKYAWNNSLTHLFVRNGFGIHMCYNTIPNHISYEVDFCGKFF
jgi:hypothetical protein